jgi:biopolymer transport protein ExbB
MQTLAQIFQSGGFVMYPLGLCSLLTWAIALERVWSLGKMGKQSLLLQSELQQSLQQHNKEKALEVCLRSPIPLARLLEELIKSKQSPDALAQKAQRRRLELNQEYKKYLWVLGTIGSATPFLGLFGTVVGILRAFRNIAQTGDAGFAVVAGEISEALIATASGIIVAVIAVAFFNYFQVRVGKLILESRLTIEEFLDDWQGKN